MSLQVFGRKKCKDSQKAERWLKERNISYQFIDLTQKAMSPRELDSVAAACGGYDSLVDTNSKLYSKRGMAWLEFDAREELLEHPELLCSPIIRKAPNQAAIGFDAAKMQSLLD